MKKVSGSYFMKAVMSIVFVLFIFIMINNHTYAAENTTWQDNYEYSIDTANSAIILTLYKGNEENVYVPASAVINGEEYKTKILNGYLVDEKAKGCYEGNKGIKTFKAESGVSLLSGEGMFAGCSGLTSIDMSRVDTTSVTDMSDMFYSCAHLISLDLGGLDTARVTNMYRMFMNCYKLTSIDVSSFNTSNVTNMEAMFNMCENLTSLDLSNFDTHNVNRMWGMFAGDSKLTSLDLSSFNTTNVIFFYYMFTNCDSLSNIDISTFDINSGSSGSYCMFYRNDGITSIKTPRSIADEKSIDLPCWMKDESTGKTYNKIDKDTPTSTWLYKDENGNSSSENGESNSSIDNSESEKSDSNSEGNGKQDSNDDNSSSGSASSEEKTNPYAEYGLDDKYVPNGYVDNSGSPMIMEGKDLSWNEVDSKSYWYEGGIKQGTYYDTHGVMGDGTIRGREIFDPESGGWYWLDSVYNGAKAVGKEVWVPYIYQGEDSWEDAEKETISRESDPGMEELVLKCMREKKGKWVRYDENGKMLKGWVTIEGALVEKYPDQAGNTYYYDNRTGLMAKGWVTIDGTQHYFNETTGVLEQ